MEGMVFGVGIKDTGRGQHDHGLEEMLYSSLNWRYRYQAELLFGASAEALLDSVSIDSVVQIAVLRILNIHRTRYCLTSKKEVWKSSMDFIRTFRPVFGRGPG